MATRELEWFDLETRMRQMINENLESTVKRALETKEEVRMAKSFSKKLEERITKLENSVFGDNNQETVIKIIHDKLAEIEGNRKKDEVRAEQDLSFTNENMKSLKFNILEIGDSLKAINNQLRGIEEDKEQVKSTIENIKDVLTKQVNSLDVDFRELNLNYVTIGLRAEERSNTAFEKSKNTSLELLALKREFEILWKNQNETTGLAKEIKLVKLNNDEFETFVGKNDDRIKHINESLKKIGDELFYRDMYIDKYFPLKIASMISDFLHTSLDPKQIIRLAEFENQYFLELNKDTLSNEHFSRETQVKKIMEDVKQIEDRKSDIMRQFSMKDQKSPPKFTIEHVENKAIPQTNIKRRSSTIISTMNNQVSEENIANNIMEKFDLTLSRFKDELMQKVENFIQGVKKIVDQNAALIDEAFFRITELANEKRKEKSEIFNELVFLKTKIQQEKLLISSHEEQIGSLNKSLASLVESSQIQQILEAQDEADRHGLSQKLDKELQNELVSKASNDMYSSALPSASFSLKKNCLSCNNGTSFLSGFRTSIVYNPTPVLYREKMYQRPELIDIKGKILSRLFESSKILINFSEFDSVISQENKKFRVMSTNDSIKVELESSREFPFLNSSNSKNRSKRIRYSKLNFKSSMKSMKNSSS